MKTKDYILAQILGCKDPLDVEKLDSIVYDSEYFEDLDKYTMDSIGKAVLYKAVDYLQEMYKNGMMYLTTATDDGYYWQGNYSANSFIKEVTDEDAIARAEAKYNAEKQKINHKEEIIDLKMKNLDTEISSLSTEYDTIKSLISKNIERGFKRYDA